MHPGGPFWKARDEGAWSIPKGECAPGEAGRAAAVREFREELGALPAAIFELTPLGSVRQSGGKVVHGWCALGDFDPLDLESNTFELEWPPRSGKVERFPEIDRAGWFEIEAAREKLLPAQRPFLDRLLSGLSSPSET